MSRTVKRGLFSLGKGLQVLLVTLAILSCGLNSSLLQLAAWIKMIPSELIATGSLSQAVENTFDGEHPCELCKIASAFREMEEGERESEEPAAPSSPSKPKEILPLVCVTDFPAWASVRGGSAVCFHEPLAGAGLTRGEPASPPPRLS